MRDLSVDEQAIASGGHINGWGNPLSLDNKGQVVGTFSHDGGVTTNYYDGSGTTAVFSPSGDGGSGGYGSVYGGYWQGLAFGTSISGGGDTAHGSIGVGLGYGYFAGWALDPAAAADLAEVSSLVGGLGPFGTNWHADLDPLSFGAGVHVGGYLPLAQIENSRD